MRLRYRIAKKLQKIIVKNGTLELGQVFCSPILQQEAQQNFKTFEFRKTSLSLKEFFELYNGICQILPNIADFC